MVFWKKQKKIIIEVIWLKKLHTLL